MTDSAYRLIAIDLDGTLLCPMGTVTPRVKSAIHGCLDAGMVVCFATGRNFTESRAILDVVDHHCMSVFVGGAMVVDTREGTTLHRVLMDPALAADVCQAVEAMGHAALVLQDTNFANVDYLITDRCEVNFATSEWLRLTEATYQRRPVARLSDHGHEHTIRVGLVAPSDEAGRVRDVLVERFGDRIFCHVIRVPAFGVDVLEVFDPSVNKWEGILHVARRHGVRPEQIIAIGDDVNDVAMLKNAGLGVAMGNARPEALAVAKLVIGANGEDGLARFLEQLADGTCVHCSYDKSQEAAA